MSEPLETELRVVGVMQYVRDLSLARQEILKVGYATDATAKTIRESRAPLLAMRRAVVGIRTAYRMQHAALIESMRLMRDVGRIGRTITGVWQAYNIAMIRTEAAHRKYTDAVAATNVLEGQLSRMRGEGITSGVEYTDTLLKLAEAKEKVKHASEDEAKAQRDNIIGYIGMGLQLANLIPQLHWMYYHYVTMTAMRGIATTEIGAEAVARTAKATATAGEVVASKGLQATLTGETLTRAVTTKGIWASIAARITSLSLSPMGWVVLGGAAIAAAGALAWMYSEQAKSQRGMQEGGIIREEGWYYLHKEEEVKPAAGYGGYGRIIINIYETTSARDTAEETVNALRRRGVI